MTTTKASDHDKFLTNSALRSLSAGTIDVPLSLGGRARGIYELATGSNPFPSEAAATPLNPQGLLGWDWSGPPWGSAVLHPIATMSGIKASTANIQQHDPAIIHVDGDTRTRHQVGPWGFYVRPFEALPYPKIAPYSRGFLSLTAHLVSAGSVALDVQIQSMTFSGEVFHTSSRTLTVTSTNMTAFASTSTHFAALLPGRMNFITLVFEVADSDTEGVIVDALSILQMKKRSH